MWLLAYLVEILNTPTAQFFRSMGYISIALSMWALTLSGVSNEWKFRYAYLSIALHMSIVSVWAAVLTAGVSLSGDNFNALISFTTGLMILGSIKGFFGKGNL